MGSFDMELRCMTDKQLADRYGLYWELEVFERLQSFPPVEIKPFGRSLFLNPIFVPDEAEPAKWSSDHYWAKGTLERHRWLRREAEDDLTLFLNLWRDWLDREPEERRQWARRCGLSHECFESVLRSIESDLKSQNLRQSDRAERDCARRLMHYHEAKSRFVRWALNQDAGRYPLTASDAKSIACDSALAGKSPLPREFYAGESAGTVSAVMSLENVPGPPSGSPSAHVQFVSQHQEIFNRFRVDAEKKIGWRFHSDDFTEAIPDGNPPAVRALCKTLRKSTCTGTLVPIKHPALEGVWFVNVMRKGRALPIYLDDDCPEARAGVSVRIHLQMDHNDLVVAKLAKMLEGSATVPGGPVAATNAPVAPAAMDAPDIAITLIPASLQVPRNQTLVALLEDGTADCARVSLGTNLFFGPFTVNMSTAKNRHPSWTNCVARVEGRKLWPGGWSLKLSFVDWISDDSHSVQ